MTTRSFFVLLCAAILVSACGVGGPSIPDGVYSLSGIKTNVNDMTAEEAIMIAVGLSCPVSFSIRSGHKIGVTVAQTPSFVATMVSASYKLDDSNIVLTDHITELQFPGSFYFDGTDIIIDSGGQFIFVYSRSAKPVDLNEVRRSLLGG
jgi:hypothetical protein